MNGELASGRNGDKFLVCYLDLLGYKQLVEEYHGSETVISGIREVFEKVLERNESLRTRGANTPYALANKIAAERIAATLISDSMFIRMPMPENLPRLSQGLDDSLSAYCYVAAFLSCISHFYLWIAGKTGHFFRGAVTKGQHYESNPVSSRNLFVFSRALVTAVELADQKGDPPWVLLDESMVRYLEHLAAHVPEDEQIEMTRQDSGRVCLDIYFPVNLQHESTPHLLKDIVKAVNWQVGRNQQKPAVVKKYRWFADYHNLKMKEWSIQDQGLTINLSVGTS